ncbi:nucleotidyltransferase family protein [Neobacillus cucumis]|nr:nucleotidyltransferase family protein [Neobacillus cucumis]
MIELIKAIYGQGPLPQDEFFYQKAMNDIEKDGIESQLYFLLKKQGKLKQTPDFFQLFLKENYEKAFYQNLFIKSQQNEITGQFEKWGIDVIPLKGIHLAESVFGHVGARATSDIDLLIRIEDLGKAIEVIHLLGFTVEEAPIPGHFHCSYSKKLPNSAMPLVVELHWSLVRQNTSKFDIADLWKNAKTVDGYRHLKELTPNHTFYMICLHGWRHNLDSMKYFIDIIQVLYHYKVEIDFEEILKLAAAHQTYKRMIRTLSILYLQFPILNDMKSFIYKREFPLWKYRNVNGFKKYFDFLDYQFFSFDTAKHSFVEFIHWVVPSKYEVPDQLADREGPRMYLSLYKKRIAGMVKALFSN